MPTHVFEWFVVPLMMFLFLFWLRDNLNILHMPLADLVSLVAVADVALALHPDAVPGLLSAAGYDRPDPPEASAWWTLAVVGVLACVLLVYGFEKKLKRIAIHHMSVGLWHEASSNYLSASAAFQKRDWRIFIFRWALSFGIATAYFALHALCVEVAPLEFLEGRLPILPRDHLAQALLAPVLTVVVFVVIAALLTFLRVFRYSAQPLPWTYPREDQLPRNP